MENLVGWQANGLVFLGMLIGLDGQGNYLVKTSVQGHACIIPVEPDHLDLNPQAVGYVTALVA